MTSDLFAQVGQLYRHFDKDGRLLYVGQSLHAIARLAGHRKSRWFAEIARVDVETFASREEAVAAEGKAISNENPLYNIAGTQKRTELGTRPAQGGVKSPLSNAARQTKWRSANPDLNRQRARDGMRRKRAELKASNA